VFTRIFYVESPVSYHISMVQRRKLPLRMRALKVDNILVEDC
jgi:hypothetical protein